MKKITTKPFIFVFAELFLVGVTARYSGVPARRRFPWALRLKETVLKEQITDDSRLFQDAVSSVSFWMRSFPVFG